MRYVGQGHEVTVELPKGSLGPDDADRLTDLYRKEYKRLYGSEGPDVPLETITWQLKVSSARPEIRLDGGKSGAEAAGGARKGEREIYLPEKDGFVAVPVYDRYLLEPGATLEGPRSSRTAFYRRTEPAKSTASRRERDQDLTSPTRGRPRVCGPRPGWRRGRLSTRDKDARI
jgi:N-methylhydantoinase A/oxoprolinase/acetone carboxylase beta subunit